jgi:hypothetical protein
MASEDGQLCEISRGSAGIFQCRLACSGHRAPIAQRRKKLKLDK